MGISTPRQPIPAHLLADLHAQNLPAETERELWQRVESDPEARRLLDTLDGVTAVLHRMRDDTYAAPAPADIVARLEGVLETCSNDRFGAGPGRSEASPRRGSSRRWIAGLSAAAVIAVVATTGATLARGMFSPGAESGSSTVASPQATASTTIDSLSHETLLAALGRDTLAGRLADRNLLSQCLDGAGVTGPVLGLLNVDHHGESGVLVLVGGDRAAGITALILGTACSADNPRVLARTELR